MICKECGSKIADGATVCDLCGAKVSDSSKEVTHTDESITENRTKDPFWEQKKQYTVKNTSSESAGNEQKTPYDPFASEPNTDHANNGSQKNNGTTNQASENNANKEPSYDPFASYTNEGHDPSVNESTTKKHDDKVQLNRNSVIVLSATIVVVIAVIAVIAIFSKTPKSHVTDEESVPYTTKTETEKKPNYEEDSKFFRPEVDIARVNDIIAKDSHYATMSVCIIDLTTGQEFKTNNADRAMSASALINIPLMYVADNLVKESGSSLNNTNVMFKYTTSGRSRMEKSQDGDIYDLDYLLSTLLAYSDNNIANTLIDFFGMQNIVSLCHRNGYNSVDFQRHIGEQIQGKDNYISASDAANIIAELYNHGYEINKNYLERKFFINDSAQYDGLGKYLPRSVDFLNHNAFTQTTYNEVCIVPNIKNPYVLAFISNDGNSDSSKLIAAQVSEYIFNTFNE